MYRTYEFTFADTPASLYGMFVCDFGSKKHSDNAFGNVVDISGKADKVESATDGNFAALDANGNLTDSGKAPTDFSKVEASDTAGAIKVDGTDVPVVAIATDAEVTEMLDEVFGTGSTGDDENP